MYTTTILKNVPTTAITKKFQLMASLYHEIAYDYDFLIECHKDVVKTDAFTRGLIDILKQIRDEGGSSELNQGTILDFAVISRLSLSSLMPVLSRTFSKEDVSTTTVWLHVSQGPVYLRVPFEAGELYYRYRSSLLVSSSDFRPQTSLF